MTNQNDRTDETLINIKKAALAMAAEQGITMTVREAEMLAMCAGIAALQTQAKTGAAVNVTREGMLAICDRNRSNR